MRVCRNSTHRVCTFTTYAIGMFRIVYRVEQYSTIVLSDSKCIECAVPERFLLSQISTTHFYTIEIRIHIAPTRSWHATVTCDQIDDDL